MKIERIAAEVSRLRTFVLPGQASGIIPRQEGSSVLSPGPTHRFGVFEVNLQARELRKHGIRVRLSGHSVQILGLLLERPGEVVTRDQLRARLWSADTFVDVEHGLNTAVKKLRAALGDSPENSRYIQTIPRVGYRFIAPLETAGDQAAKRGETSALGTHPVTQGPLAGSSQKTASSRSVIWVTVFTLASLALVGTLLMLNVARTRDRLLSLLRPGSVPLGSTSLTVPPRHSIAVLPLENLSGEQEQDY